MHTPPSIYVREKMDLCLLFVGSGWTLKTDPPTDAHQQLAFASARLQAEGHIDGECSGMLASLFWPA